MFEDIEMKCFSTIHYVFDPFIRNPDRGAKLRFVSRQIFLVNLNNTMMAHGDTRMKPICERGSDFIAWFFNTNRNEILLLNVYTKTLHHCTTHF
jgi:hypothetical protein